jgi:hypothetical protein
MTTVSIEGLGKHAATDQAAMCTMLASLLQEWHSAAGRSSVEKKRKDYAFRHQCNEKPSIIPGCPETKRDLFQL